MIKFICSGCRNTTHELCPGDTWCDCQHRTELVPESPTLPTPTAELEPVV